MGTFHLNHEAFKPILARADELISESDHYFGEMDLNEVDIHQVNEIMQKQARPTRKVLKHLAAANKYFEKNKIPALPYPDQMPLFSMLNELTLKLFRQKLLPGSIDEELLKMALKKGNTIGGLESFSEQMEIMSAMKPKHLEQQIVGMLKKPAAFSRTMDQLLHWYVKGKTRKLYKSADKNAKGHNKLMIHNRNKIMANRILDIISGQRNNFFSFGAGHLNGKTGIANQLRKKGILVTKLPSNPQNSQSPSSL